MQHEPLIHLPYQIEADTPRFGEGEDRYPESLVRYFLNTYTKKGQKIFDPFFGLGTTAFVAEELGRIPYGVEADTLRHEWTAGQIEHWNNLINDDSINIPDMGFPKMDFCITSPPFMRINDKWNPLYEGDPKHNGYDSYLTRMAEIFVALSKIMKKNAYIIIHVDNIDGRQFTPLVRNIGTAAAKTFHAEGETIVMWDKVKGHTAPDRPHTHCLVFKKM